MYHFVPWIQLEKGNVWRRLKMLYFKILIFLLTVIFTVVFGTPTRGHSLHRSAFSASETQNSGARNKTETPEESSESESSEEDQDEGLRNRTMTMPLQNHMPPTTASPPRQVIQAAVGSVKAETTRTPSKPTFDHEEESQYGNIVGSDSGRGSCGSRFLPTSMSRNITRKCIDLIGFRMDNFPPKEEDLVKINYEDKCFSKCYLNELNYVRELLCKLNLILWNA